MIGGGGAVSVGVERTREGKDAGGFQEELARESCRGVPLML